MFVTLTVLFLLWFGYLIRQYFVVWRFSEKFVGKKTIPLIGNIHQVGNNSYEYLQNMFAWANEFQFAAYRLWMGPQLYIMLTNPKDVEVILSSNKYLEKFQDYRFLHDWIGQGLITSKGQQWFTHRKLITPAFHFKILTDFHQVMNKGVNQLIKKFEEFSISEESLDIQGIVNLATLDIICETAMGVEVHALDDPGSNLVGAFHDISQVIVQRVFSSWKRFDFLFPLSKDYKMYHNALKVLQSFNKKVLSQKKKRMLLESTANNEEVKNDENIPIKRKAFLDLILNSPTIDGVPLTDEEITDETSTFIFAGHDTTAAAVSFVLYHLSIYPDEQKKVYEEQVSMFGDDMERDSTYQEVQDMKYLDMFIKESHRLIPPVSLIGRTSSENIDLNGKIIPSGASIGILLYAMGYNPDVFPEPNLFNPERFLTNARTNTNPYEYVPFSAGPRNCIGQRFAIVEVRTVIAKLVRIFEILKPDRPFKPMLAATATTRSTNGVFVRLRKR